jgi:glyoxylase-like metal-dependent hydrolase (beta-lactamase superfamily II)
MLSDSCKGILQLSLNFSRGNMMRLLAGLSTGLKRTAILLGFMIGASVAQADSYLANKHRIFVPGDKLLDTTAQRLMKPYLIQRIGTNSYWIETLSYNVLVYVGKQGVLIVDPPEVNRMPNVLAAIRELTLLPVTTVLYTHAHADHIAGASFFVEQAKSKRIPDLVGRAINTKYLGEFRREEHSLDMRNLTSSADRSTLAEADSRANGVQIVARWDVAKVMLDKNLRTTRPDLYLPNRLLPREKGQFRFENIDIEYGPVKGHSEDNTWFVLKQEGVMAITDQIVPGRLPMLQFLFAKSLTEYEESLAEILPNVPNWRVFVAGHGDIGTQQDFTYALEYLRAFRSAILQSLGEFRLPDFIKPGESTYFSYAVDFAAAVQNAAVNKMEKTQFGKNEEFKAVARSHAEKMFWNLYTAE